MQFSLEVKEGFWIKNGQIDRDHQVKNIMLTGNGIDVIKRIDRVGKKMKYEKGGFCGASSGLIPINQHRSQWCEFPIWRLGDFELKSI